MKTQFNLGYNFDPNMPNMIKELNLQFAPDTAISSVFGSDGKHAWLTARPTFRLPNINGYELAKHVQALLAIGVEFNYTMNTIYPGSKQEFAKRIPELIEWAHDLVAMGVKRFIISNPIVLMVLRREAPKLDVAIEISTIAHLDTPMQIKAWKQMDVRVDRIVSNLLYNRDFTKLKIMSDEARRMGMGYELMVNEFCATGSFRADVPMGTQCIFRDSCYLCHAENKTETDALLLQNYPMGFCMSSRATRTADWLRTGFIRPEDLRYYEALGIRHFKITGRTAKTPYVKAMAEAYLSRQFDGNVLQLWKPLETIYSGKDEFEHKHVHNIPNRYLGGFISKWQNGDFTCNNTICADCMWCDKVYETMPKGESHG